MVSEARREAATERAYAAIAKAEEILSAPRPTGPLWEGSPPGAMPAPGPLPQSRAQMEKAIAAQLALYSKAVGKVVREALAPIEARLAELEDMLTRPEA